MSDAIEQLRLLGEQLDQLQDLFRRRLLDDKDKRRQLDWLSAKVEELERARSAEAERPLVNALALVIDRLQNRPPDDDFARSIVDELGAALELIGVQNIQVTEVFEARRHEVARVDGGTGDTLRVTAVLRRGYEKAGVTLRPAQVAVVRVAREDGKVESVLEGEAGQR